jgi:hypothetical protein
MTLEGFVNNMTAEGELNLVEFIDEWNHKNKGEMKKLLFMKKCLLGW